LPSTIPLRGSEATKISRRNPLSRSLTTDAPLNRDVVSTACATMPGYMNRTMVTHPPGGR